MADPGVPSVQEVVDWASANLPDDPAPLPALLGTPFERVEILIPEPQRATGNLAERLRAHTV